VSEAEEHADEPDEEADVGWPLKGPATGQQAILAIAFVFFFGVLIGFLLCRTL
jgi:hypothetical protein